MSMLTPQNQPKVPTMPQGNEIAVYSTYLKAQKAVDKLSDEGFAVQGVTIVGHDLHMVERVLGRLTYPRIAVAGFASGAWFGLFVGLLLSLFGTGGSGVIITALLIGGAFGLLFSVLSYAMTRGKRDFTSSSQIVAARYVLLCIADTAGEARSLLHQHGVAGDWTPTGSSYVGQGASGPAVSAPVVPTGPARSYGQAIDQASGKGEPAGTPQAPTRPQYGAMRPVEEAAPAPESQSSEASTETPGESPAEAPTEPVRERRELQNPDNPFSPPKE